MLEPCFQPQTGQACGEFGASIPHTQYNVVIWFHYYHYCILLQFPTHLLLWAATPVWPQCLHLNFPKNAQWIISWTRVQIYGNIISLGRTESRERNFPNSSASSESHEAARGLPPTTHRCNLEPHWRLGWRTFWLRCIVRKGRFKFHIFWTTFFWLHKLRPLQTNQTFSSQQNRGPF